MEVSLVFFGVINWINIIITPNRYPVSGVLVVVAINVISLAMMVLTTAASLTVQLLFRLICYLYPAYHTVRFDL